MIDRRSGAAHASAGRAPAAPRGGKVTAPTGRPETSGRLEKRALAELARRDGVATSYIDQAGTRRHVSDDTVVAVLAALGEPISSPADAPDALAAHDAGASASSSALVPPVVVAWNGRLPKIVLDEARHGGRSGAVRRRARIELDPEALGGGMRGDRALVGGAAHRDAGLGGGSQGGSADRGGGAAHRDAGLGGGDDGLALSASLRRDSGHTSLLVEDRLPYGLHRIVVEGPGDERVLMHVVAAPRHAGAPAGYRPGGWGVFAPAYSLRDRRGLPAGDLTSLRQLGEIVARRGATVVATLPMLAELSVADGGSPGQSPYSPLSRMWWNEGYLDLERLPELAGGFGPPVRQGPGGRQLAAADLAAADLAAADLAAADLAGVAAERRPLLECAVERLEASSTARRAAFRHYCRQRPDVVRYARFRAAIELRGASRERWPAAWRGGRIPASAVPEAAVRRHLYAQWAMDTQLGEDAATLATRRCGYLLDLPVGCRPDGYDPWAFPDAFAYGARIGAPPDTFFGEGQDWGFPPPHPEGDRRAGYPMLRACLVHGLRHAAALRIDHALGWSRLWWIPPGMSAADGAYVRYRLEELLAVACLESHRHGARLIGEDLGTVEPTLERSLRTHRVAGMRVAVFDIESDPAAPLGPPATSVAYVDTHDTATFAGFLGGGEIDLREALGMLDAPAAVAARRRRRRIRLTLLARLRRQRLLGRRDSDERAVLAAVLDELGASSAELVVVNLEDLWGETDPHNVPGTVDGHRNFARRLQRTLEELGDDDAVLAVLDRLDAARRRPGGRGPERARGERR